MRGRQVVNPGEVVVTDAGRLSETHEVKQIFHAAAVYGVVGLGFQPIAGIEQCVTNALVRMDFDPTKGVHRTAGHNEPKAPLESILFPLLGSGTARADLIQSARKQVDAAIRYSAIPRGIHLRDPRVFPGTDCRALCGLARDLRRAAPRQNGPDIPASTKAAGAKGEKISVARSTI